MRRVKLIHWSSDEAAKRAQHLKAAGYDVDYGVPEGPSFMRELSRDPAAAVVIDLSRLPAQGRDIALAIRKRKATRHIPLVFMDGDPAKVARIKEILPDAVYTSWTRIGYALREAMDGSPDDPVVPSSVFEGYSGKPLVEKLGIKASSIVALIGAPEGFSETLGDLPEGAQLRERLRGRCDLLLWFTRSRKELQDGIERMAARAAGARLWIAWPKKASSMATDLSQQQVRDVGIAAGLVDYKICSIDETWSGLLFTPRKPKE